MIPNLHNYQRKCVDFIKTHPYCGLYLDMGLGKTLITLSALKELGEIGQLNGHILIIAPKNIARSTWVDEIEKWQIPVTYKSLIVNDKGRSYSRAERLALYKTIPKTPPTMWFINRELLVDLIDNTDEWYFPHVIIDESQGFKSHRSKRFEAMKRVRPFIERIIELSGTPAPNGPMDLWAQIWLMDTGQRLGKNITAYRNTFFRESRWNNGFAIDWEVLPGMESVIYQKISDLVISLKNTNLQLPPITYNNITVHMTDAEKKKYKKLLEDRVLNVDKDGISYQIAADNPAILTAKLSQLASGTIYLNDKDILEDEPDLNQTIFTPTAPMQIPQTAPVVTTNNNKERNYSVLHEHKLEHCQYIVDNTDSPVLIAYHFKSDKAELLRYFKALYDNPNTRSQKYLIEAFDGSPEMIRRWNNKEIPVMILQPASAGHGLNIQYGGHTLVWYTLPWSLEEYLQCNARIYRQGQTEPVVVHHLLTKGTIDTHILNVLNGKEEKEDALMEAVKLI